MILRPLLLCCLATPALAECPTADDLATGIRATMSDGTFEDVTTHSAGVLEMIGNYEDGYVSRFLLGQGTYVLESSEMEDGKIVADSRVTYSYSVNATEMPVPSPNARWKGKTAGRDFDGFFQEEQVHSWGELTRATYGDCSYDLIIGYIDYVGDGYEFREEIHYLPELGLGLLAAYTEENDDYDEVYTYVSLEKLPN